MPFDFISNDRFLEVEPFALNLPPTWTRLEPQSVTGDPTPGIEARVHDPLWLLGRQWQLGEFAGEDAGTPLTVRVVTRTTGIDRWAPRGVGEGASQALGRERADLLEPLVEREPVPADATAPGLRGRAEAGSALLAALDDAGLGAHRDTLASNCPLDFDPEHDPDGARAALDPAWTRLQRLLTGGAFADAELVARAFEDAPGNLPPWLVPADDAERAALLEAVEAWRSWYRAEVSPPPGGDDAWVGDRLEYASGSAQAPSRTTRPPTAAATSTGTPSTRRPKRSTSPPVRRPLRTNSARCTRCWRAHCATPACPPTDCGRWRTRRSTSGSSRPSPGTSPGCSSPSSHSPTATTGSSCRSTCSSDR